MMFRAIVLACWLFAGTPTHASDESPVALFFGPAGWMTSTIYAPYADALVTRGYRIMRVDLPCNANLRCWRHLSETQGDQWIADYVASIAPIIAGAGRDPLLIGTSRAGFMALHAAAAFPSVRRVAAIAPVVEMAALKEFAGARRLPAPLVTLAGVLSSKRVFLAIGTNDERVGTRHTVALADAIGRSVTLLLAQTDGHAAPPQTADALMDWVASLGLLEPVQADPATGDIAQ